MEYDQIIDPMYINENISFLINESLDMKEKDTEEKNGIFARTSKSYGTNR